MNTNKNKQLLWKVLYNNQYFAEFENNQFDKIKELFEDQIAQVDTRNDTLLNKNKLFIKQFIKELDIFKKPYKREDIINNRKNDLLDNFNKKTNELNEFKYVPPPDIDFSDLIEETPINLLNDTTKLSQARETDLPVQPQILTILKEIKDNQQKLLDILSESKTSKNSKNNNTIIETISVPIETDLIDMDINE